MLRILISAAEALGLLVVLLLALSYSVPLVIWVSLGLLLIAAFVLITGQKAPRIQSRGKALVVGSSAMVCMMVSATIYQDQRGDPPAPTFNLAAMIAQSDDLSLDRQALGDAETALVRDLQPTIPGLPLVEGRRAHAVLPAHIGRRHPGFLFLQDANDLFLTEP